MAVDNNKAIAAFLCETNSEAVKFTPVWIIADVCGVSVPTIYQIIQILQRIIHVKHESKIRLKVKSAIQNQPADQMDQAERQKTILG